MDEGAQADPLIGRTVADGRYQVLARLGTGGMGTVYRVRQHPLERLAALKLIHRELAFDAIAVGRFEREMRVTAAIEHPHTVRVYDFGQIDGQPFLAMEYLAGRSLRQALDREGALVVPRVAAIGVQIAKALGAAHRAGVVHRDLKPDNVMLVDGYGERDFVKVLDFGIARSLDQAAGFRTSAGALVGTPAYMSPEQASGAPIDTRSDLYALGVILYEMLAGSPPFTGDSVTALLFAHATKAPPPLPPRLPRPPALEAAVFRLLAKDPAARPASADEVIDLLSPFLAGPLSGTRAVEPAAGVTQVLDEGTAGARGAPVGGTQVLPAPPGMEPSPPPSPSEPSPPPSLSPPPSRPSRRPLVGAGVTLIVLAAAAAGGLAWRGLRRPDASDPAALARAAAELRPYLQAVHEPPWPDACGVAAPALARDLAAAAAASLAPGAGASAAERARGLASLRALDASAPARWMIEARVTLATEPEAAARAAARAVALCPSSAVAQNLLGNAQQKLQKLDQAEAAYREALRLAPPTPPAPPYLAPRFNLGLIALRRGDAAAALASLDEVARAQPDYPNLFLARAEAHRRAGDPTAAAADLEEQVKRNPDGADGWYQLGRWLAARDPHRSNQALCRAKALGSAQAAGQCRE